MEERGTVLTTRSQEEIGMEHTIVYGGVEVQTTRSVVVGRQYRIHPSYAWMGIESGIVEVTDVTLVADMEEVTRHSVVDEYERIAIEDDNLEFAAELRNGYWVRYSYKQGSTETDLWIPLSLFVDHTLAYM